MSITTSFNDRLSHLTRESKCELQRWRSSGVFPDNTQNRIRDLLAEAYDDIEKLNLQISSVKDLLSSLLTRKNEESERISILRSAISPIKNIPPEILSHIFELCDEEELIVIPPKPHSFPWTLAQVCSRWRKVLWTASEIWKNIEIRAKPPRILSCDHGPIPTAMRSIISNTTSLVWLKVPRGINDSIVEIILSSPGRFKTLDLSVDHCLYRKLLGLPRDSFSALEALNVKLWGIEQSLPPFEISSLQSSPSLRRVSFDVDDTDCFVPCILLLPWAQLTDIQIHHMNTSPSTLHSLLQLCTSLTTANLSVGLENATPPKISTTIFLPRLTSLGLSGHRVGRVQWGEFLRPFVLPALDEFALRTSTSAWSQEAFISLVDRSTCRPRVLSIHDMSAEPDYIGRDNMETLLQALPDLVDFETSYVVPPTTFRAILQDGLVPNLENLCCRVYIEGLESFTELMRHYSVSKPCGGVRFASIRCFTGRTGGYTYAASVKALYGYKAEGRNIDVSLIDRHS